MKLQVIYNSFSILPFVEDLETDSLQTALEQLSFDNQFQPMFVVDFENQQTYRVVKSLDSSEDVIKFLSNDAHEHLGVFTKAEGFKRISNVR